MENWSWVCRASYVRRWGGIVWPGQIVSHRHCQPVGGALPQSLSAAFGQMHVSSRGETMAFAPDTHQ